MALLGFPNPVDEKAARTVAAGVVLQSGGVLVLAVLVDHRWLWLSAALAYGFLARVLTGPKLSPLGRLATRVIAPRLGAPRLVPGPPKRFAQGIGAAVTTLATLLVALGFVIPVIVLLAMIIVFALLESGLGLCVGCIVFARLMRAGIIPPEICAECADVSARTARAA